MTPHFLAIERALRRSAPHALIETLRTGLVRDYGALAVEVVLADYSLTALCPVAADEAGSSSVLSVHRSPQGRAFVSQEPLRRATAADPSVVDLHLPLTVHGDRLGVLTVTLPDALATGETEGELLQISELLGGAIIVAQRETDQYEQARRLSKLTLAAEMQWQLLPGRSFSCPQYSLGAQLEPAYSVRGDNFDWSVAPDALTLAVTNGMGEGMHASMLTNLAVNALRNARRANLPITDQAMLADEAIYHQHRGDAHVSTLLMHVTLSSGHVSVVDAGSPQLWIQRDKAVERLELDAQLPLGMFAESRYIAQQFHIEPGDRLVVVSDGVYAATSPTGESYAERSLARAISTAHFLPAADVPSAVLRGLATHRSAEADDDALVLCLDWHGSPAQNP
ncbi:serine/threonine-protein phosphatase [Streptacidiphilus sp. PB12-B1b]|uniref:PP2C family protein-serine/threonine phosphatase n=1 Tax=Streptacidiphilus sp. PB12-B1b TaxID=2705012 RepID=UPI0015F7D8C7|nr:PP2C family protein-serine/threonine phosphatase [Streptacidiphilus sp. PB12-B1b]QMU76785.1 serine/threonine-protein phosphatase [Streptacidiphilus sp. PB12-B1b]